MSREWHTDAARRVRRQAGFSMIETLVTAALVGVVATIAVPRIPLVVARFDVSNAASQIAVDLRLARERAVTTNACARLSFVGTAYTRQTKTSPCNGGGGYATEGASQSIPAGLTVTTNPSTPQFDSRGTTTQAYTVTITNAYGNSKTITVSTIGRITVS